MHKTWHAIEEKGNGGFLSKTYIKKEEDKTYRQKKNPTKFIKDAGRFVADLAQLENKQILAWNFQQC